MLADNIRTHACAENAEAMLQRYLSGAFTGASFETIGGRGDAPEVSNRFTPADLVALTTLSVDVPGRTDRDLEEAAGELGRLLADLPVDVERQEASDQALESRCGIANLAELQTQRSFFTRGLS